MCYALYTFTNTFDAAVMNSIRYKGLHRLQVYNWYDLHAVIITRYHISAPKTAVRVKFHPMGKLETDTCPRYILTIPNGMIVVIRLRWWRFLRIIELQTHRGSGYCS